MGKAIKQPAEDAGEDTVWVSFRIAEEYAKKLDEVAAREDRSRASVLRRLIVREFTTAKEKTA